MSKSSYNPNQSSRPARDFPPRRFFAWLRASSVSSFCCRILSRSFKEPRNRSGVRGDAIAALTPRICSSVVKTCRLAMCSTSIEVITKVRIANPKCLNNVFFFCHTHARTRRVSFGTNSAMKRKDKPKPLSEQEKDALRPELAKFYESVSPALIKQGAEGLRRFGVLSEEMVDKLTNPERFAEAVLSDPKVSAEGIDKTAAIVRELQANGVRILKPALREMIKDMPRIRGGGRPHSVPDAKEKREMIEEVLALVRFVKLGTAMNRVALRHGVSRRTMQRIWAERLLLDPNL